MTLRSYRWLQSLTRTRPLSQIPHRSLVSCSVDPASHIATISLNAPPVNALSLPLLNALQSAIKSLPDQGVKGILLTSTKTNIFSAGLDLTQLVKEETESDDNFKNRFLVYLGAFQETVKTLISTDIPTVALVQGACPAGGTVLCLSCDFRLAPAATNGLPFIVGLNETAVAMAPPIWIHHLTRLALPPRSADRTLQLGLLYTSPQQALKAGFVDELVDSPDCLVERGKAEIERILRVPWNARSDAKRLGRRHIVESMTQDSLLHVYQSVSGSEFQANARALMAKLKAKKK